MLKSVKLYSAVCKLYSFFVKVKTVVNRENILQIIDKYLNYVTLLNNTNYLYFKNNFIYKSIKLFRKAVLFFILHFIMY